MTDLDRLNPGILRPQGIRRARRGGGLFWALPLGLFLWALVLAPLVH